MKRNIDLKTFVSGAKNLNERYKKQNVLLGVFVCLTADVVYGIACICKNSDKFINNLKISDNESYVRPK